MWLWDCIFCSIFAGHSSFLVVTIELFSFKCARKNEVSASAQNAKFCANFLNAAFLA